MLSLIEYGVLGIVVAVGVVALLILILPADHLAAAPRDVVPSGLPANPEIRGTDVARVRLPVTLRGYRMVDTDAVLDRLAFELVQRDQEIDDLRQRAGLPPRVGETQAIPAGATAAEATGSAASDSVASDSVATGSVASERGASGAVDGGDVNAGDADAEVLAPTIDGTPGLRADAYPDERDHSSVVSPAAVTTPSAR